jgi:hypothetical protein
MNIWLQRLITFLAVVITSFFFGWLSQSQAFFFFIFVLGTIGSWEMTDEFWPSARKWIKVTFGI